MKLKGILAKELEMVGLRELLEKVEHPLVSVLAGMEFEGVKIDEEALKHNGGGRV